MLAPRRCAQQVQFPVFVMNGEDTHAQTAALPRSVLCVTRGEAAPAGLARLTAWADGMAWTRRTGITMGCRKARSVPLFRRTLPRPDARWIHAIRRPDASCADTDGRARITMTRCDRLVAEQILS
jgi:hypothetical protein